jgi:hypothetical protein
MKKHLSKKRVVLAAIVAVVLAISSGVAYAYWSGGGTGQSTAVAASSGGSFTVNVTLAAGIYPGGTAAVTGTVKNTNSMKLRLHQVIGDSPLVTFDSTPPHNNCLAGDFSLSALTIVGGADQELAASTGSADFSGTLSMADSTTISQDMCKGAQITLHVIAS